MEIRNYSMDHTIHHPNTHRNMGKDMDKDIHDICIYVYYNNPLFCKIPNEPNIHNEKKYIN